MPDAGRFFAAAIPAPGGAPVTTGEDAHPGMETAGDMDAPPLPADEAPGRAPKVDLGEHRALVEERFRKRGWDAVAFYAPYHRHGPGMWGIYFVGDAFLGMIDKVDAELRARRIRRSQSWIGAALRRAIQVHELFHFRVEWTATHAEVLTGATTLYDRYLIVGRTGGLREPALTEEALATAHEVRRAQRIDAAFGNAVADLSLGLPGYGDFARYLSRSGDEVGCKSLIEGIVGEASTGELLKWPVARSYEASVPTRWIEPQIKVPGLEDLLLRLLPVQLRDVLRDAERRPGAFIDPPRGKHPHKVRVHGKPRPVPLSSTWDHVPPHVMKQLAELFDLSPGEYAQQVLARRRDRPQAA